MDITAYFICRFHSGFHHRFHCGFHLQISLWISLWNLLQISFIDFICWFHYGFHEICQISLQISLWISMQISSFRNPEIYWISYEICQISCGILICHRLRFRFITKYRFFVLNDRQSKGCSLDLSYCTHFPLVLHSYFWPVEES